MRRRAFIAGIAGATLARPRIGLAQQPALPVIGFLSSASPQPYAFADATFRQSLSEAGYVGGQNLTIEYRWADGHYDRLPALATDLVRRPVTVIVAAGSTAPALAAKAATSTIPIVFIAGGDPLRVGLVASLSRPRGNVTGVTFIASSLTPKLLELLHQLVPGAAVIAALVKDRQGAGDNDPAGAPRPRR